MFDAFTRQEHVEKWWGPRGFSVTTHHMDVRPGGSWRYVMHGPDRDYENLINYDEVVRPTRLTYRHGGTVEVEPVSFRVEVTFTALPEEEGRPRTLMVIRSVFPSEAARRFVVDNYGALDGSRQTFTRLAEYLDGSAAAIVELTRSFSVPAELVYDAWLDEATLGKWLFRTPGGVMERVSVDPRVGGAFEVSERRDGVLVEHHGTYEALERPKRIVFTFRTAHAATATRVTVEIRARKGGCDVNLRHEMDPVWLARADGVRSGWGRILDDLLATVQGRPVATDPASELLFTRRLDTPIDAVWQAWTDGERVRQWWGPALFDAPLCQWPARVGEPLRIDMRGPDGTLYPMGGRFTAVSPPHTLVFTTTAFESPAGEDTAKLVVHNTLKLAEQAGRTLLMLSAKAVRAEGEAVHAVAGMRQGWSQSLEKLTDHLTPGTFVLRRLLKAPREVVFDAWTRPEQLAPWFGPKGMTTRIARCELRPGGVMHYSQTTPTGQEMWGKWEFREVVRPERLVLVSSFSDAAGGVTRHPMAPNWPLYMESTTTFEAMGNATLMTLRWKPLNATPEERVTFESAKPGMEAGWAGTLAQLDAYLAGLSVNT